MPRFLPTPAMVVVPDFLDAGEDRGGFFFDTTTKSTMQKVSTYTVNDVCDEPTYRKASQAISVNGNDDNCKNGLVAAASLSVTVPIGTPAAAINALIDSVQANVVVALTA